jgi:hypothetical protein
MPRDSNTPWTRSATEWAAAELVHPGGVERNLEHLRAGLGQESPGAEHVDARRGRSDPVRTRDEHEDDVSERTEEQQDLQAGTPALREEHRLDRLPQAVRLLDAGDRLLRPARVRELGHPAAAAASSRGSRRETICDTPSGPIVTP